jgi:preprotein translocase subunit YajC
VEGLAGFLPFILIAVVFWFLIVRPQRRRQHELASTQSALGPGAEVMLGSGIYGTVVAIEDDTIRLELAPGTTVKVARQAVIKVVDGADVADDDDSVPESIAPPADAEPDGGSTAAGPGDERHP